MKKLLSTTTVGALLLAVSAGAADGQMMSDDRSPSIELRGGLNVPTFDIGDIVENGPSFGATFTYPVHERWSVMAEGDFGFHDIAGVPDGEVDVNHYMAKVGYLFHEGENFEITLNAGAGAMSFSGSGDNAETFTYPAINVGAKIAYEVSEQFSLVFSPQGDIAFSDEEELAGLSSEAEAGASTSWVWPFSAGIRVSL